MPNPTPTQIEKFLEWFSSEECFDLGPDWTHGDASHTEVARAYAEHLAATEATA